MLLASPQSGQVAPLIISLHTNREFVPGPFLRECPTGILILTIVAEFVDGFKSRGVCHAMILPRIRDHLQQGLDYSLVTARRGAKFAKAN